MTLLTIATAALAEIGEFNAPSAIIGSTDPTAVQLLALAKRSLRTLANDYKWQALLSTYTFATVASTATYALPTDYGRFANLTFWDRTNLTQIEGPLSPSRFEALRSSSLASPGMYKNFRIAGSLFEIYPTPTAIETIAYQYYSKYAISGKETYTDDADVPLLDSDLLTIDLRWRFLQAKGADFASEKDEAEKRRDALRIKDGGNDAIRFGPRTMSPYGNLPESGYGA